MYTHSDVIVMQDFFRELFLQSSILLCPHLPAIAVGLVDVAELVDEVVVVLHPAQAVRPHWDL